MCNDKRGRAGVISTGPKIAYNCRNCGFYRLESSKKIGKKYKDLAVKLGATNESVKKLVLELMKIEDLRTKLHDIVIKYEQFNE